jgi:hypothetical protein
LRDTFNKEIRYVKDAINLLEKGEKWQKILTILMMKLMR